MIATAGGRRLALLMAGGAALAGCQWLWPERYAMREAEAHEAAGRWAEAAAAYEAVFTKWPGKPETLIALERAAAIYEERLGNWRKAATYLQELKAKVEGRPEYARVLLRLGRVLESAGSPYRDSLDTYGHLCRTCSSTPEALQGLLAQGRLYEGLQMWPAAKSVYEEALAKLGAAPEAATVRSRLESVWLLEATGLYYGGRPDEGAALAKVALDRGVGSPEARLGLESLLSRYQKALRLRGARADSIIATVLSVERMPDGSVHLYRFAKGAKPEPPRGWLTTFDEKTGRLTLTETITGFAGAAPAKKRKQPWVFRTKASERVEAWWWSPEGTVLIWLAKAKQGRARTLNTLSLETRKSAVALEDKRGRDLGGVAAPYPGGKMVFVYQDFLRFSDLAGRDAVLSVPHDRTDDRRKRRKFDGARVEWFSISADGVDLAVGVALPEAEARKARKGAVIFTSTAAGAPAVPPVPAYEVWKIALGVQ